MCSLMLQVWSMQQGHCLQTIPNAHGPSATPTYAGLVMGLLPYQVCCTTPPHSLESNRANAPAGTIAKHVHKTCCTILARIAMTGF